MTVTDARLGKADAITALANKQLETIMRLDRLDTTFGKHGLVNDKIGRKAELREARRIQKEYIQDSRNILNQAFTHAEQESFVAKGISILARESGIDLADSVASQNSRVTVDTLQEVMSKLAVSRDYTEEEQDAGIAAIATAMIGLSLSGIEEQSHESRIRSEFKRVFRRGHMHESLKKAAAALAEFRAEGIKSSAS